MADHPDVPEPLRETLKLASGIRIQGNEYVAALRDWVARGRASGYRLPPAEVTARSGPRGQAEAEAAACFELGTYLWDGGKRDLAPRYWRDAHRLQPDNWTYKRQAWTLVTTAPDAAAPDLVQEAGEVYGTSWLDDVLRHLPDVCLRHSRSGHRAGRSLRLFTG